MIFCKRLFILFLVVASLVACSNQQTDKIVSYSVYNAGSNAIFPVTSTIFYGKNEAMLVDAQFTKQDAQNIVNEIQKSGKPLTLIYISHGDPDFYFGLETILSVYPQAQVVATQETVDKIVKSAGDKLKYWRAKLAKQAPSKIIIPNVLVNDVIYFADEIFEIRGNDLNRTYLWLPSMRLIVGGSLLSNNMYLWTADAKTSAERLYWDRAVVDMLNLHPDIVIPGHYLDDQGVGIEAIEFTHQYLKTFDYIVLTRDSTTEVIDSMKRLYPNLGGEFNLDMSTKITLGEFKVN